ncbi:copper chaperone PCu(A)C [Solilutibacter silvestris]|uniref:copper chaperone PCu(A)C n=1 Tax=Solilutibacter silvestris TaxID=1645665 RepID=UPI003D34A5C0
MKTRRLILAAILACAALPAFARDKPATCMPVVRDAWIRLVPGGMPMHAGFARIENPCDAAVTVTGVSSDAYGSASLHESTLVNGISRMRELPQLVLPAHGSVELKPGGLHLMLMDPKKPLKAGDRVALRFDAGKSRNVRGDFAVRAGN